MSIVLSGLSLERAAPLFLEKIRTVNPAIDTSLIERAFHFAWQAHRDQVRKSGEPFLAHPVAVAVILAEQKLDPVTICAGLLHDVLEDTDYSLEDLGNAFGEEIALLVDGVTKISSFQVQSIQERQAETYRKMLLSMARDVRVIVIKFADRLHNLRTLTFLDPERKRAIARETLDIYAPLAHRLGMARIKWDLEDLAFRHLHEEQYKEIVSKVVATHQERETLIERFAGPLRVRLKEEGIEAAIVGRPKHFYSIYQKMVHQNRPFEEIYDLLAIRVIVGSLRDCYHVLGIVHSLWTPIQDRFKDFISTPKTNGYQSLHTTVFGQGGHIIETQIRTWEMNQVAEDGIAAHWLYKDGSGKATLTTNDKALVWLKNIIEWQKDLTDSSEFYELFKVDLFDAEIFVFTPRGDLISLPKGATVLDFAFAVHTHLGLHCIGAKVDGKFCPINTALRSGSTVEILQSSTKTPSTDWLRDVKTPKARSAIRRWLKNTGRQESIELGKKILASCYRKLNLSTQLSDHIPLLIQHLGVVNIDRLHEQIGTGEIPINRIIAYFKEPREKQQKKTGMVSKLVSRFAGGDQGVLVGGENNIMVRFAQCCSPIPGEPIVGFVTRGRGISIHSAECLNAALFAKDRERAITVSWDEGARKQSIVFLDVHGEDRPGLLHDITETLLGFGVSILDGQIKTTDTQIHNTFKVQIQNRNQLKQILNRMRRLRGVHSISRLKDSQGIFGRGT